MHGNSCWKDGIIILIVIILIVFIISVVVVVILVLLIVIIRIIVTLLNIAVIVIVVIEMSHDDNLFQHLIFVLVVLKFFEKLSCLQTLPQTSRSELFQMPLAYHFVRSL